MNLYLLEDPYHYQEFARFSHVGTWSGGDICESCGQRKSFLIEPLQIEWEADSDVLGDFSWCGYTIVVNEKVKDFFLKEGFECRFGAVEVVSPSSETDKKRVSFPYSGSELFWVLPIQKISIDEKKSGVELKINCSTCNQKKYTFRREGIFVNNLEWQGQKMFQLQQFPRSAATYLTEDALRILLEQGFSNIGYIEAGKIQS